MIALISSARLSDVCRFQNGGTPSKGIERYFTGDIPWITGADLVGPIALQARSFITEEAIASSATNQVPAGTVLLVTRTSVGKVAIAGMSLCFSQDITALTPDAKKLSAEYLVHYLRTKQEHFTKHARGATIQGITREVVADLEIPLPPLEEQRRIAAILDQAETLRTQRRLALAHLDTLTQSLFLDMFGDPVANERNWPDSQTLGEVADIASGVTKGRNLEGKVTRELPYLAVANVQNKSLRLDGIKSIDATEDEIRRYLLRKNDLLLTEGGDPDKLGRGTLWNDELPECIHQNHIFRVRLTTELLTPLFLNWLVGSPRGKKYFLRSAKQTTGIASINMTQLKGFPLLVPPLSLQQTFATRIAAIEALKTTHRTTLAQLNALFASLQQRAFAGEL